MPAGDDLDQQLAYALQLAVGATFALSVAPKLRSPAAFVAVVAQYDLLPARRARAVAVAIVAAELALALCFIGGWLLEPALALAALLVIAFGCGTAINLRRGRDIPCGCFGGSSEHISSRSLARLSLLLAVLFVLALALSTGTVDATALSKLAGEGASGLTYFLDVAGATAFLMIAATWLLSVRELRWLLDPEDT